MIRLTKEGRDRLVRYLRKPTEEELSRRKEFMEKVNSRIANREEIESKLVKALKDLNKNKNQVKYIFTWWTPPVSLHFHQ